MYSFTNTPAHYVEQFSQLNRCPLLNAFHFLFPAEDEHLVTEAAASSARSQRLRKLSIKSTLVVMVMAE